MWWRGFCHSGTGSSGVEDASTSCSKGVGPPGSSSASPAFFAAAACASLGSSRTAAVELIILLLRPACGVPKAPAAGAAGDAEASDRPSRGPRRRGQPADVGGRSEHELLRHCCGSARQGEGGAGGGGVACVMRRRSWAFGEGSNRSSDAADDECVGAPGDHV